MRVETIGVDMTEPDYMRWARRIVRDVGHPSMRELVEHIDSQSSQLVKATEALRLANAVIDTLKKSALEPAHGHRCGECGWMKYPDAVEQIGSALSTEPKTISTTLKRDHRESGMQVTEADKGGNSNHVSDGARQDARFVHPVSQWSPKTEEQKDVAMHYSSELEDALRDGGEAAITLVLHKAIELQDLPMVARITKMLNEKASSSLRATPEPDAP